MSCTEPRLNEIWEAQLGSSWQARTYILPLIPQINKVLIAKNCMGSLLDIGCSNGSITSVFPEIGFNVQAIDGDPDSIREAKENYPEIDFCHFFFKDRLPFEDDTFDVVFSCSVFQYLDHEKILSECKRVLKKGGVLILIENLKNNPITRVGRAYLKLTKHKYHSYPWNHFTLKELKGISHEFDDASIEVFHFFSPLAYSKFFRKFALKFLPIDSKLLRIEALRNLGWLALYICKNK